MVSFGFGLTGAVLVIEGVLVGDGALVEVGVPVFVGELVLLGVFETVRVALGV